VFFATALSAIVISPLCEFTNDAEGTRRAGDSLQSPEILGTGASRYTPGP